NRALLAPSPRHFRTAARAPQTLPRFPYTTLFRSRRSMQLLRQLVALREPGRAQWMALRQESAGGVGDVTPAVRVVANPSGGLLRSEEHTSELQSLRHLVCLLLLEKKKTTSRSA